MTIISFDIFWHIVTYFDIFYIIVGKSDMQTRLDTAMLDVNERFHYLEETEKNAVRKALIEERKRFCLFISYLKPLVVSGETLIDFS